MSMIEITTSVPDEHTKLCRKGDLAMSQAALDGVDIESVTVLSVHGNGIDTMDGDDLAITLHRVDIVWARNGVGMGNMYAVITQTQPNEVTILVDISEEANQLDILARPKATNSVNGEKENAKTPTKFVRGQDGFSDDTLTALRQAQTDQRLVEVDFTAAGWKHSLVGRVIVDPASPMVLRGNEGVVALTEGNGGIYQEIKSIEIFKD